MSIGYPSDISREQFAVILPILESSRHKTKPRTIDLYDIFCGICYVLKSGCQWRMLPPEGRRSQTPKINLPFSMLAGFCARIIKWWSIADSNR